MTTRHRFRWSHEDELQVGIAQVLAAAGIEHEREAVLAGAGRIDFLLLPRDVLLAAAEAHTDCILRIEEYLGDGYKPREFDMALPPRTCQAREAEVLLAQGYLLVADDVGLGKIWGGRRDLPIPWRGPPWSSPCPTSRSSGPASSSRHPADQRIVARWPAAPSKPGR